MTPQELCAWLREHSSGVYRPAADAADLIEQLLADKAAAASRADGSDPDAYVIEGDASDLLAVHFKREDADAKVRAWGYGKIVPVFRHENNQKDAQPSNKLMEICLNWKSGVLSGQEAMFSVSRLVISQIHEAVPHTKSPLSKRLRAEADSPHPSRINKDDLRAAADEIDRLASAGADLAQSIATQSEDLIVTKSADLSSLTRYEPAVGGETPSQTCAYMDEELEGEWVKFADVQACLSK
jgi:hypothetical protein